jgi:hypothetical protein
MDDSCFNGNFKTKDECHLYADKRRLDSRDLRCACQFDRDFSGSVPAPTGPRSRSPGRCCCAVWSDHGTLHRGLKIQSGRRIRYSFYLGVQVSDCRLLLSNWGISRALSAVIEVIILCVKMVVGRRLLSFSALQPIILALQFQACCLRLSEIETVKNRICNYTANQSQTADVLTAGDSRGRFRTCLTRLVGDETLLGAQKTASRPQALDLQFLFLVERALSRRCPSHGCRAAPGSCTPASMAVLQLAHSRIQR